MSYVYGFSYHFFLYVIVFLYGVFVCSIRLISVKLSDWIMKKCNIGIAKSLLFFAGVKLSITGLEKVIKREDKSYILVANHVSTLDPITILVTLKKNDIRFVYSLMDAIASAPWAGKFIGVAFNALGWIGIKGTETDTFALKKMLTATRRTIKKEGKVHVGIFPEGRRTVDGTLSPFESGFAYLSILLQIPIIPVLLKDLYLIHNYKSMKINPGEVKVEILDPIIPPAFQKENLKDSAEKLKDHIQSLYENDTGVNKRELIKSK